MGELEQHLVAKLTDVKEIARVYESKLREDVFEEPIIRAAFNFAVEYWLDSNMSLAPTWMVLEKQFPALSVPHQVEEATEWLVEGLKKRWIINQLQEMTHQMTKTGVEDPEGTLDWVIADAAAVRETAGLPEPPKWDWVEVAKEKNRLHSKHEAKRRFEEEMAEGVGPTSWEPVDLGPYLRGEVEIPRPTLGVVRGDGQRFLYPGAEHSIISDTGAGKTWIAIACAAAEIAAGNHVVYVHYEEANPASIIERLLLLDADADEVEKLLTFVGPSTPVRDGYLQALLDPAPTLVLHDGANEAMALHEAETKAVEGSALFRRRLLVPFLLAGAATLTCDHFPMGHDPTRLDAYGSVHKGTALSGARFALENVESFGRGLRGRSKLFVTKDRPGFVNRLGRPTKVNGKRFLGTLVIDNTEFFGQERFEFGLHAPTEEDAADQESEGGPPSSLLHNAIYRVVYSQPDHTVESQNRLFDHLRQHMGGFTDTEARRALGDLVVRTTGDRLIEVPGKNRAKGYQAVPGAA